MFCSWQQKWDTVLHNSRGHWKTFGKGSGGDTGISELRIKWMGVINGYALKV